MPRAWRGNYEDYLKTDHWRALAERVKDQAGRRCQVCNSDGRLEAHHRTYDNLGAELPGDVIALCGDCHSKFHDKTAKPRRRYYNPTRQVALRVLECLEAEGWGETWDFLVDEGCVVPGSGSRESVEEILRLMVKEKVIIDRSQAAGAGVGWYEITNEGRKMMGELLQMNREDNRYLRDL